MKNYIAVCSPFRFTYRVLRDESELADGEESSWETFSEDSLVEYLHKSAAVLCGEVVRTEDTTLPYTREDADRLMFMAGSVAQARLALDL